MPDANKDKSDAEKRSNERRKTSDPAYSGEERRKGERRQDPRTES